MLTVILAGILSVTPAPKYFTVSPAYLVPGQYVIGFNSKVSVADAVALCDSFVAAYPGSQVLNRFDAKEIRGCSVDGWTTKYAKTVSNSASVKYVDEVSLVQLSSTRTVANNVGLDRIDQRHLVFDGKVRTPYNGAGERVYIVDTGCNQLANPQFGSRVVTAAAGLQIGSNDTADHGTAMASLVGSADYGSAPSVLMTMVKFTSGTPTSQELEAGIQWLLANAVPPAVINFSNAIPPSNIQGIPAGINALVAKGFAVVAAAGNDGVPVNNNSGNVVYPAAVASAITVGAVSQTNTRYLQGTGGSNYGPELDLFGPAVAKSIRASGMIDNRDGTSASAALTSGVVATLRNQDQALANSAISLAVNDKIVSMATPTLIVDALGSPERVLFNDPGPKLLTRSAFLPTGLYNCGFVPGSGINQYVQIQRRAVDTASDAAGNVYILESQTATCVTGFVSGYGVVKLNAAGVFQWQTSHGLGSVPLFEGPSRIYVDAADSLFASYTSYYSTRFSGLVQTTPQKAGPNVFVEKLDPATGATVFTSRIETDKVELASALSCVEFSKILVGGSTNGDLNGAPRSANDLDAFVVQIDRVTGQVTSIKQFGGSGNDSVYDIASIQGSAVIAGTTSANLITNAAYATQEAFIAYYDPLTPFTTVFVTSTAGDDSYKRLFDHNGILFAAGETTGALPNFINQGNIDLLLFGSSPGGANFVEQAGTSDYDSVYDFSASPDDLFIAASSGVYKFDDVRGKNAWRRNSDSVATALYMTGAPQQYQLLSLEQVGGSYALQSSTVW
jgi:hypothetical protein